MSATRLRIASITRTPPEVFGGMRVVADWLEAALREPEGSGSPPEVVHLSLPYPRWRANGLVHPFGGCALQDWLVSREVERRRGEFDAFVLHAPAGSAPGPGLTIHHLDIPDYIRHASSPWSPNRLRLTLVDLALERNSARRRSGGRTFGVALCRTQADSLRAAGIAIDEIVSNPVDASVYRPPTEAGRCAAREAIGAPPDAPVALSVARHSRGKGWERVVELARSHPAIDFPMVGFDPRRARGLPPNARPLGMIPRTRMPEVYRAADLFVFLPAAEGFGLALAEAMASGVAALATPAGLGGDLLAEGGPLAEGIATRDPREDAARFHRLLESPALRAEMGEAGRARVLRDCDPATIAARYRELLRRSLAGSPTPA